MSLSTYVSLMLNVRTKFPRAWWICSNILLKVLITKVLVLAVIPYYFSIKGFMNSLPIDYDLWSYMISVGLAYIFNHVVSTNFVIYTALLSSYCVILNHPVTGSIKVTAFIFNFFSLSYYETGTYYIHADFVLWYLLSFLSWYFTIFYFWPFCTLENVTINYLLSDVFSNPLQYKCLRIVTSVISIPGWSI